MIAAQPPIPALLRAAALVVFTLSIAGCTGGKDEKDAGVGWQTVTRKAGDTTVVRTTGVREHAALLSLGVEWTIGSPSGVDSYAFGSISELAIGPANDVFVFDRQFVTLRQYDSTGKFVRVIGGRGAGPGEYERINGLALHDDGRLVMWNATTAKVDAYSPSMALVGSWTVPGGAGFNTSGAIFADTGGNSYVRTRVGDPPASDNPATSGRMFGITGLLRYNSDGAVRDSLRPPDVVIDVPRLVASVEGNSSMSPVPFSPQFFWTFSPLGAFVSARSDVYAINITSLDGKVVRIEMAGERVAVTAGEKSDFEKVMTANMRGTDPDWKWNGAPIPDVKPYFKQIAVGRDGRIWISLSRAGEEIPVAELPEPRVINGRLFPVRTWREPAVFDVFESDGQYLGRVAMPSRSLWRAAAGESVWAVTRDSLDMEHVTRYRIATPRGKNDSGKPG